MSGRAIGVGKRGGSPTGRRLSCWGQAQDRSGRPACRVLEQLAQLGKAKLDEAIQPLAELGLFGDQSHRKAGCLAQLDSSERIASFRGIAHGHLGKAPGIGRIGLGPPEPALRKVARREWIDHCHRNGGPTQVRGKRHPVVARGLHDDEFDGFGLRGEPGVERGEARPALAHPQDLAIRLSRTIAAAGRYVGVPADVDADGRHPDLLLWLRGSPHTPLDVA